MEEAASDRYQGIAGVTEDPIVSSDIFKDSRASIIDLGMTRVVDGNLIKILLLLMLDGIIHFATTRAGKPTWSCKLFIGGRS